MPDGFDDEAKETLYRIDERTKSIEGDVEDVEDRVEDVEERAQKNRTMIAKFTVVIGAAGSAIGAIFGIAVAKIGALF